MPERCLWYCHCGLVTAIVHAVHLVTEQQIHAAAYSRLTSAISMNLLADSC